MLNGILSRVLLICNRKGAPLAAVKVEALVRLPSVKKKIIYSYPTRIGGHENHQARLPVVPDHRNRFDRWYGC